MKARFEEVKRAHPDGTIVAPRIQVSQVTYEPFLSQAGNPLGLRIKYEIQFSADGYYSATPHVFPIYADFQWRGQVTMTVLNESIDPPPAGDLNNILRYGARAQYKTGVVYHFAVDMVPDYVLYNAGRTRTCIQTRKFEGAAASRSAWEAIKNSDVRIRYRVALSEQDFYGETGPFYAQKTFYESFLKEGAVDCGPNPNVHF